MGITTEDFFQNVYKVMFDPKSFFESEQMNVSVRLAAIVIILMSMFNKCAFALSDNSINDWYFVFTLIFNIISSLLIWFFIALFFEYIAKIFNKSGNLSKLLYLSAFATIPVLFFAPLNLLKHAGEAGYVFSVVLSIFLYLWILFLYAYTLKSTYGLTIARSFMLLFLPLISSVLAIYQIVGFSRNMWYIFSI